MHLKKAVNSPINALSTSPESVETCANKLARDALGDAARAARVATSIQPSKNPFGGGGGTEVKELRQYGPELAAVGLAPADACAYFAARLCAAAIEKARSETFDQQARGATCLGSPRCSCACCR